MRQNRADRKAWWVLQKTSQPCYTRVHASVECGRCRFLYRASVVEWSITTDCKSVASRLRRFESCPAHKLKPEQKLGVLICVLPWSGFEREGGRGNCVFPRGGVRQSRHRTVGSVSAGEYTPSSEIPARRTIFATIVPLWLESGKLNRHEVGMK